MAMSKPSLTKILSNMKKPDLDDDSPKVYSSGYPDERSDINSEIYSKNQSREKKYPENLFKESPFSSLVGYREQLLKQQRSETQKAEKTKKAQKKEAKLKNAKVEPEQQVSVEEDQSAFLQAMSGVVPINDNKIHVPTPKPIQKLKKPLPILTDEDKSVIRELDDLVSGKAEFDFSSTSELLEATSRDLSYNELVQLRKGYFPIQDHLDVHGYSLPEAEAAINSFISRNINFGHTCVLLVHGRGHGSPDGVPIIKRNLKNLLLKGPYKKNILAFTTARPIDGGSGASYILLR
jgi:DNA-nicking Smr family endonuclease